jgi:hypothetical protein
MAKYELVVPTPGHQGARETVAGHRGGDRMGSGHALLYIMYIIGAL